MDHIISSLEQKQHQEIENSISTDNEPKITESLPEINGIENNRLGDSEEIEGGDNVRGSDTPEENTVFNKESQSKDHALSTSNNSQTKINAKEENGDQENLGKDSVCVNSDILDKRNCDKANKDQIKRLSSAIVNDVIDEAKNILNKKSTNVNDDPMKENVVNESHFLPNESQTNGESHFVNGAENLEEKKLDIKKNETGMNSENANRETSKFYTNEFLDSENNTLDDDSVCGFGCFKPSWIQQYARPKVFLILFSIIGIIHGCYYSYFVSIISTLEKRYAFQTKVSGILLLADEITPLFLGIIVGYIGTKTHRPRMVALGMFASCACCFISGLPYLIYGPAKHLSAIKYRNETGPEFCDAAMKSKACDAEDAPPTMTVVGIFLVASFLKGFATLSYYVIGISYMDDNIKKKNSPLYLAIALALRLLGPLLGFLVSSIFLKYYENPLVDPGYGPDDPRWIGAWWIGFFLQGVLLTIFTIPIALFPRRLPGQRSVKTNTTPSSQIEWKQILLGFVLALKRLRKNPVFILQIINTNMIIFGQFGHSIMLPKYMENQFRLSASEASLYSGATSITMILVSTVVGGFLIWKFRPRIKVLMCGMVISELIMCIGFLILMFLRCETVDMVNSGTTNEGLILKSICNEQCDCSTTSFTPYCGQDSKTYFSPCFAGCTQEKNSSKTQKAFGNCSCLTPTEDTQLVSEVSLSILEGFCPDENCWSQALVYLIILFIMVSISSGFTVVNTMILLRSVLPKDKSFALGTFETFICLFGFIPFPITIGALVDSACLVWEESCGETGNCWFYDMDKFSYLLHGVSATFCFFSVLCLIALYYLSSRIRDLYADEDEEEGNYDDIKLDTASSSSVKL